MKGLIGLSHVIFEAFDWLRLKAKYVT